MKSKATAIKMMSIVALASTLVLAGCQSTPPVTKPDPIPVYPGNDIDAQEQELSSFLNSQGIPFTRQGSSLIISLPETVTFASGSAVLKPQAVSTLGQIGSVFTKYTQTRVNVIGHTDSTGTDAINDRLSLQRAESVAKIFRDKGVGNFRLETSGAGSKNPVASNDTAAGKAQNRRVEVVLAPIQLKR